MSMFFYWLLATGYWLLLSVDWKTYELGIDEQGSDGGGREPRIGIRRGARTGRRRRAGVDRLARCGSRRRRRKENRGRNRCACARRRGRCIVGADNRRVASENDRHVRRNRSLVHQLRRSASGRDSVVR